MSDQALLRVVVKMLFPFILVFGVYVISHGELGPGGGFQGGVILAAAFILYGLVFDRERLVDRVSPWVTDSLMAIGVLIYAGCGLVCMHKGGAFLDYTMLRPEDPGGAEALGMTIVEYGVGITVCSVMMTIYTQVTETTWDDVPDAVRRQLGRDAQGNKLHADSNRADSNQAEQTEPTEDPA